MKGVRIVTSDDTGLLKLVDVAKEEVVKTFGTQAFENGIQNLSWYKTDESVIVSRKNGSIDIVSIEDGSCERSFKDLAGESVVGLEVTDEGEGKVITTATGDGVVQHWKFNEDSAVQLLKKIKIGSHLEQVRCHETRFATGGKEQPLQLFEREQDKPVWKSKNVRMDKYELRVPVWVRDIAFFPKNEALLATITGHRQFRVYDIRAQRRPVHDLEVGCEQLNCLTMDASGTFAYCGDANANVQQIDLRNWKKIGRYKGYVGAVNRIAVQSTEGLLAGVGLGRHLVVHNARNKRKPLHNVYLKQRLTGCLFANIDVGDEPEEKPVPEEERDVWETLEQGDVKQPSAKRYKPDSSPNT